MKTVKTPQASKPLPSPTPAPAPALVTADKFGNPYKLKGNDKLILPSKLVEGKTYEVSKADVSQHLVLEMGKTIQYGDGSIITDPTTVRMQFFSLEEFEMTESFMKRNGYSIIEKLYVP